MISTLPGKLYLESGFAPETVAALRAMGYMLRMKGRDWGNGKCVWVDPKTGEPEGGPDHRGHYGKAGGLRG